jgi:thymidylate synthase (FAD)
MKVQIVATTTPVKRLCELGIDTGEKLIVHNARVSNPSNQFNHYTGPQLLRHCIVHKHWSVFDQADMTLRVTTSRAISAQIIRHWSFFVQEFSQRYASVQSFESIELRKQAEKNRQSSESVIDDPHLARRVQSVLDLSMEVYNELIARQVARECARMVLPMASQTTLYMKGTVREWIHYILTRTHPSTQKEHRLVAEEALAFFKVEFPEIHSVVFENPTAEADSLISLQAALVEEKVK